MPPPILQHAWVVPSLETAIHHWHATYGLGPFLVNRNIVLTRPRHRGAPGQPRFSTALAQHGGIQIELIEQHEEAPSVYRDTVPAGATAFHHLGLIAPDYDAELARYQAQGHAVAADGCFGKMRFAYIDTTAALGHMTEILEDTRAIRGYFAMVSQAAAQWDGDPATLIRELG